METRSLKRICVFCGSSAGTRPEYAEAARQLGRTLAGRGIGLVYGGGRVGLMGEIAKAVLAAGGHVTGVIPRRLAERDLALTAASELRVVGSMHERKALMAELADAFVALPGGLGTVEELFEALTWTQLGIHRKPCGLLDVAGYYGRLGSFLEHAVREGFVLPQHAALLLVDSDPERLLKRLHEQQPATADKVSWALGLAAPD